MDGALWMATIDWYQYFHPYIKIFISVPLLLYVNCTVLAITHHVACKYASSCTLSLRCASGSEASWMHSVPPGLAKRLKGNVLVRQAHYTYYTGTIQFLEKINLHNLQCGMQLSMAPKSSEQALGWLPLNY